MSGNGVAQEEDPSWSSIPTRILLAELRRRQDEPEDKPECGSKARGHYDTPAHVIALILILGLSTLSCALPLLSRKKAGGGRSTILMYCQQFGTGVMISTAFVHLLPTAFESLTDPCLPHFFTDGYPQTPGLVAMVAALAVAAVEAYLTARGAGHSHNHDFWDDHDTSSVPLRGTPGMSQRRRSSQRPTDISLRAEDDATQGLVAAASPLPGSTPLEEEHNGKPSGREFDDGDSDLDLELDELDPAPSGPSRNGAYSSLKVNGHARDGIATDDAPEKSPEDLRKQMVQCMLLEAGILFHSVFIGMAISVATGPPFVIFLVAISFHQTFEGLALGSQIAAIQFPRKSIRPWLMVLAFGLTTPFGQAIGLLVHKLYDPQSMGGLLVVGFMNAISAGLLLYAGLVQLLAEQVKTLAGPQLLRAFVTIALGAVLMAVVGGFA